jgi:hypothetical protein
MKKIFLLFMMISLVLFSCKKDAGIDQPQPVDQKMTEMKFSTSTVTLSYNADGSVKTIHRDQGPYIYDHEFSYAPGKVFFKTYLGGKKSEFGEYTMLNGKAIAKDWESYNLDGTVMNTFHETYTYNAKGLIEKFIYTNGAYWKFTFNDKGDITSSVYYDENGVVTSRAEYEYWDTPNKFPYMTDNNVWGDLFFIPRYSKHLLKIRRSFNMPGDIQYSGVAYQYDLNSGGYPVKTYGTELFPGSNQWSFTTIFQ